ncbi:MAG: carbon-nitrogen hydrolase family protein [Alteromonadaceae bacterium]|nr:carbon-nitrogen hydrolase family protein [Alteromonadaceae bacterium]
MNHFSIAALQLALPSGDNLDVIAKEIIKAKQRFPWLDMLVLSELCSYGPDKSYAQELPCAAEKFYCQLAKEHDLWLIPGSLFEKSNGKIFNTTSVINNQGEVVARYRKIFPFYPYESGVEQGQDFVVFDVPQGRIGIAICYDLWFPEIARSLACKGAEVLIYPTMTATIDRPIELILAQATAATNQCYVLTVNASGDYGNGQSIVVAPDGKPIYQASYSPELIPVEIDFARVRRERQRGLYNLGQPLKSFRDNRIQFPVYSENNIKNQSLMSLGELKIPSNKNS